MSVPPRPRPIPSVRPLWRRLPPLGLALAAVAVAAPARFQMQSFANMGGVRPALAWCEAQGRVLAVGAPQEGRLWSPAVLRQWSKRTGRLLSSADSLVGPNDGAAGTVFFPLVPPGQTPDPDSAPRNFLALSNVESTNDPAYRMTRVSRFQLGGQEFRCRYVPQAAFLGVTARRTVIVWESGNRATYATRNFDGTAGVSVGGGAWTADGRGKEYTFANGGYRYVVHASPGGAFVRVLHGTRVISEEPMLAYSLSVPRQEQP